MAPLVFVAGIISRKSNSSDRRLTAVGCLGVSSARREKRFRNRVTAEGAAACAGDSVETTVLVGERTARELLAEVAIDIMEGMPSRLALGVGEPDEGALPRSMLEREKRPMSPAVFPCESVPGSPEPGTYEEDIESAEEPRVESHDSNEKGVALPPVRADCSQDSDVLMSLFKGLF
jgi:hypothetical protein